MKKKREIRKIALGLAVILTLLQIMPSSKMGSTEHVKAAGNPQDVSTIIASGAAVTVDPALVMSGVTATEITKYSITYQWSAVPNATSYYVYKFNVLTGGYEYYTATSGTAIQVTDLPAGEECYMAV